MSLEAKGNHVLLEIITRGDQLAEKYKGSLIIQGDKLKQDEPNTGRVYSIGSDVPADRIYKVGDTVVFHTKEIFQGFPYEDKKLCSMPHEEILAIVTEASS